MNLEKLRELAVSMYSALLATKIPEKHQLHIVLIAVSDDGAYMPMTHGIGCNDLIGLFSSDVRIGDGPDLSELRPIAERLGIYLRSTNIAQNNGIHFILYVVSSDFKTYIPALFGLKTLTARGVASRAVLSVNQAILDSVRVEGAPGYKAPASVPN